MASPKEFDKLTYLESVIKDIADIVTILEANGTIRYESPSITPVLGYLPSEIQGKNVFSFVHPQDYKRVFEVFMANIAAKDRTEKIELRFKHKNGTWRDLECNAKNLLFDSNVRGIVVCSRDITERRKADLQMRLQSKALSATSNGIVITDKDGTISWVNPAFTKMTGYSFEEAVGKNPRILKSGEQNPKTYEELWATILSGKTWAGEIINRRKDGSLYFEKQTITPVMIEAREITHFIAIKEDISADKRLEAQFRQAQKMEAIGRLAGGVAHDFNNILTVILGQADLLLFKNSLDESMRSGVEEIKKAGARAANLTRQLLAFSRKQMLQNKIYDINEIIVGADKMLRRLVGEDIEFVTLLGENLKPVKVDAGQIEQVIMNLVVNARDAMPKGGKIVLETSLVNMDERKASSYPGMNPGSYLQIKVQDTGTGISKEVMPHLFEPFFTTKEKGKGTGLGLATVYGIIKQSKGFIYAESEPGKGAAFLIFLPPAEGETSGTEEIKTKEIPGGHETILVAEDEELVRALTTRVLTRQGFKVLEAKNGLEAMRICSGPEGSKIQMLITDMVMPYMGEGELAEKFLGFLPGTPVIFTSGYSDQSTIQKWLDKGYRFLPKPYTYAELLIMVREVLDQKK